MNECNNRGNIKVGSNVGVVLKQDQRSGKITQGIVKRILTNSSNHPHGIKVELENGQVGRVKEIHLSTRGIPIK
ncbi:MAG: YwbE family protein [Candidatus Methanoperedens sp.]